MKAIITGMNGTVAPVLSTELKKSNIEVTAWDRNKIDTENYQVIESFIKDIKPEYFFHLAMGSPFWAESCAKICYEQGIKFLFTSTASVYDNSQVGPHKLSTPAGATSDYGVYKIDCEKKILNVNPEAYIVRLGWQIGETYENNNMLNFFETNQKENGKVAISSKWFPSCSFLDDTAAALYDIITDQGPGLYLLNSNTDLSLFDISQKLNMLHNNRWNIVKDDSFIMDNRMVDGRVKIISLPEKFQTLLK